MPCEFTYEHYIDTMSQNLEGVYVRHDVDYSFQKAYEMAMIEADNDIQSTYMVQLHSPFYNPLTQDNLTKLKEISEYHTIGIHYDTRCTPQGTMILGEADYPGTLLDVKVELFAAHDWLTRTKRITIPNDLMNMEAKYISDSGGEWREGCFCQHLGKWDKLQALIHPEWWWKTQLSFDEKLKQIYLANMEELNDSHKSLSSHLVSYFERRKAEFHKEAKAGQKGLRRSQKC